MTFQFAAESNHDLLNSLLRNPSLYSCLCDDFSPPLEEASVNRDGVYVLAIEDKEPFGFWMFIPQNVICWDFHTVMPLNARALEAMKELLGKDGWLWRNTRCRRAVTSVPDYNRIACRFGKRAGLEVFGINPDSFQKDGQLIDQILMGISRPKDN